MIMYNVTPEQLEKLEQLKKYIKQLGRVAVAFSSGVDSTFLLKVAHDMLGDDAIAITASSCFNPMRECEEAIAFCEAEHIAQKIYRFDPLSVEEIVDNPPDRCYICKKHLLGNIVRIANENNIVAVVEGSNVDDLSDYRPGMKAVKELGVLSPLKECGMTKLDIRCLSNVLGLATYDKPSFACLASRFVYGETIDEARLKMVEQAEELLHDMGYASCRVRIHGMLARIEVQPDEMAFLMQEQTRNRIITEYKRLGFTYVTLDMIGYRTGSMNETLNKD